MMNKRMSTLGILISVLAIAVSAHAQQAKNSADQSVTHLRVDVVLTEYNGDKKVSSLPYAIYTASRPSHSGFSSIRMGVRVPVASGSSNGGFTYMDVGTSIDCRGTTLDDGSYDLDVQVSRSSIYAATQDGSGNEQIHTSTGQPVVRNFNTNFQVALRDGETNEGTSATDPLSGHVLKISVTLHVIK